MKQVARIKFNALGAQVFDDGHHLVPADEAVVTNALRKFRSGLPNNNEAQPKAKAKGSKNHAKRS